MEIHQQKIVDAARKLGIGVRDLSSLWGVDAVELSLGGRRETVFRGRVFSSLRHGSNLIADHKHVCKQVMKSLGIRVPEGLVFPSSNVDPGPLSSFLERFQPSVCKPLDGGGGMAVRMGLTNLADVLEHVARHADEFAVFLLEQQVNGGDLRIQAVGGRLVAACIRVPTTLVGDGHHTVRQLIELRNQVIQRQNPENHVSIDHQVTSLLSQENLELDDVVAADRRVVIKKVANMTQGATAVDVTDRIHPRYGDWIERIAAELNMPIFSLDIITQDLAKDPAEHAMALEINSRSAWLHHTFSEGRRHDIPTLILRDLFRLDMPEGELP